MEKPMRVCLKMILFVVAVLGFVVTNSYSEDSLMSEFHYGLPVLPGVSGYGLTTEGGKGGQIIKVTNLNKDGAGSLAEAINTSGPRVIVFEVGGVIDLERATLRIDKPYVTIAGQTAPSPGITIIKGSLYISGTHDVIVQHITVRVGEAGYAKQSGWERDAISVGTCYNVIIDHCTATWATDENLSVSGSEQIGNTYEEFHQNTSRKVTVSNCIIAHGLNNSTHSKGSHSMGSLLRGSINEILIYGNLYAHNKYRNPLHQANTRLVIANNYVYNYGTLAIMYEMSSSSYERWQQYLPEAEGISVVEGNEVEMGPSSTRNIPGSFYGPAKTYWVDTPPGAENLYEYDVPHAGLTLLTERPFRPEGLVAKPRSEVKEWVLKNVGARPWDRDPLTGQLIDDIKVGGGKIIDSETEAGGYPSYTPTYREFVEEEWDLETMTRKQSQQPTSARAHHARGPRHAPVCNASRATFYTLSGKALSLEKDLARSGVVIVKQVGDGGASALRVTLPNRIRETSE